MVELGAVYLWWTKKGTFKLIIRVPVQYLSKGWKYHYSMCRTRPCTTGSAFILGFVILANVFYWPAFPFPGNCVLTELLDLFQCFLLCTISLLPNELLLGNPGTVALALMKRTRHWETKQVACRKAMRASAGWRLLRSWISNEVKWGRSMTISWTRRLKWGNESVLSKLDWLLQRTKPPMRRNRSCRRVQPQSVVYD